MVAATAPWQLSPQELQKIAAKAMRRSLSPAAEKPAQQPQPTGSDDARSLADNHAQTWNDFVAAGMPPSEHEIAEVDAELEGSPWRLQEDADGKWMVVAVPEQPRPSAVKQFSREGNGPVPMDLVNARLLDVPDIRQEDDYSCGAACAMSVGEYFGVGPKTLEEWKKELGTDVEESTRPTAIVNCFRKLGCHVEARDHLTINDLTDYWRRGMPVICCIQEYGVPDKQASFDYGHYVVVIGAAIGQVFVQDPSIDNVLQRPGGDVKAKEDSIAADQTAGRMMIDATTWMKCWHDQDADGIKYIYYGIAIGPPNAPERGRSIQFSRTDLVLQFAAMRAPYGTGAPGSGTRFMVQGGKPEGYLKGQFIPGGVIDNLKKSAASGNAAAKQQVAELEQAHGEHQATQEKNAAARRQRDLSQLKGRLAAHAESGNIDPATQQRAMRGYRALRAAHGDLVLHRLDELSEQVQERIDRTQKNITKFPRGTEARAELLKTLDRLQGEMGRLHEIHRLAEGDAAKGQGQAQGQSEQTKPEVAPASSTLPGDGKVKDRQAMEEIKPTPEVLAELAKLGPFSIRDDGMLMGKIDRSLTPEARADLKSFAQILEGNEGMSYVDRARAFMQRQSDWKKRTEQPERAEQEQKETAGLPPAHPQENEAYNVAPPNLHLAPDLFQYKISDIDPETGTTPELHDITEWKPSLAGVVSVWRDPATGKDYVVNGHHRYELANRLGVKGLLVRYIDAATAREARVIGAQINIAEGRGTAIDAAKYMRDSGMTPEDMQSQGISLKGKVAAEALVLSRLSDRAFQQLTQGTLDQSQAVAVAKHLADPEKQNILFAKLQKKEEAGKPTPPREVEEMAQEMAHAPTSSQATLFGEVESPLFDARARVRAHVRGTLAKKVNDFLAVASKRRAAEVGGAGNVLNVEENKRLAQKAAEVKNDFNRLAFLKGPVGDALNQAAVDYDKAKTQKEKNAVLAKAVAAAQGAVFRDAGISGRFGGSGQPESTQPANAADTGGKEEGAGGGGTTHPPEPAAEPAPVSTEPTGGSAGETGLNESPTEPEKTPEPEKPIVQPSTVGETQSSPPAPPNHPPAQIQAALNRYKNRAATAQGGGLFGGEELQSRTGFSKLPDQTPIVFTNGEFEGKTGKIVHDTDPSTGQPRIVAEVDGRPGLVPITPDAIEPLNKMLSWRTEGGGTGASQKQGGLFTADQFLPRRENKESSPKAEESTPSPASEKPINLNGSRSLADAIHEVGATVPDAIGEHTNNGNLPEYESHKPLLSDIYEKLKPRLGGASLDQFKNAVLEAHQNGDLQLSRNDMPQAVKGKNSFERVQASKIAHPLGATFHTVNTNSPAARRAATAGTKNVEKAQREPAQAAPAPAAVKPPSTSSGTEHPLLTHLSAKKPRSLKKIAERAGMDKGETAKLLRELIKQGRVKVESGDDGDRYVLSSEKQSVSAPPAKQPPERPAAPMTKPMPPARTPPPPPKAPPTPAPSPAPRQQQNTGKAAQEYRTSPEYLNDLERFAQMSERRGDTARTQDYRERAAKLRTWLQEHNRLARDFEFNPGVHEREKPANEGMSQLADVIAGKQHAAEKERPIVMQMLSPEARRVVEQEQKSEGEKQKGRGRPGKSKIIRAAQQLSQMKQQLASDNPALDTIPEPDEENPNPEPITMRQRLQQLADQTEKAIAGRDVKELERLQYQRDQMEVVLQFMRTGQFSFAG